MPLRNKLSIIILLLVITALASSLSAEELKARQELPLFQGEIKGEDINIRSDSTVSSEVIVKANRGELIEVINEQYDWYKVRLPYNAPSFIKKDFVELGEDGKGARVLNDNVNIRLKPDTASAILGRLNQDDIVSVLADKGEWYRIKPIKNSFGWVHKSFVRKFKGNRIKSQDTQERIVYQETIVEGIIRPKTFTRIATHKLILEDSKVYLLKADIEELNPFNGRKVKITGKLVDPAKQKYPIIEVEKIEALD